MRILSVIRLRKGREFFLERHGLVRGEAERKISGFDHALVGAELARLWKLPESIIKPLEYHHEPQKAETFRLDAAIVHIANTVACMAELVSTNEDESPWINPVVWEITGLTSDVLETTMTRVQDEFEEVFELLYSEVA